MFIMLGIFKKQIQILYASFEAKFVGFRYLNYTLQPVVAISKPKIIFPNF
jgi:hypothetical protein